MEKAENKLEANPADENSNFSILDNIQMTSSLPITESNKEIGGKDDDEDIITLGIRNYQTERYGHYPRLESIVKENNQNIESCSEGENCDINKVISPEFKRKDEGTFTENEIKTILDDINNNLKFDEENIKKSYSKIADDYLAVEDYEFTQNGESGVNDLNDKFQELLSKNEIANKEDLLILERQIDKSLLELKGNYKVGPVSTLENLIETSYNSDQSRKRSIIENFISLEDIIFRWRKIGGDGNCYYRAVMYGYLENIVFEKNIPLLKYFILDMYKVFYNDQILIKKLSQHSVKKDLVIKILIILHNLLVNNKNENKIIQAYERLLKSLNNCQGFDYGLVLYFRFKLYEFIKQNENKLYTKDFSVKIGNLLPSKYETEEGDFLFSKFYDDFLMKLYKDAEKIVIYLTPFVLKLNINILVYDFGKNNIEKLKQFPCLLKDADKRTTLTLLYKKTHYDLIYKQKYFDKFTKYLTIFVNLNENLKVMNSKMLDEISRIKKNKDENGSQDISPSSKRINENEKMKAEYTDINMLNLKNTIFIENNNKENLRYSEFNKNSPIIINNPNLIDFDQKENENSVGVSKKHSNLIIFDNEKDKNNSKDSKDDFKKNESKININNEELNIEMNINNKFCDNTQVNKSPNKDEEMSIFNINEIPDMSEINKKPTDNEQVPVNYKEFHQLIECPECKVEFIKESVNMINYCKNCSTNEIKTTLLSQYLIFLQTSRLNFREKKDTIEAKNLFNFMFSQNITNIFDARLTLKDACKMINLNLSEFINKEIKSNICIICENKVDTKDEKVSYFALPCQCLVCCTNCIKIYFNLLFLTRRKKEIFCICASELNSYELKELFYLCHNNNFKPMKERILEIFRDKIISQCMICLQERKQGYFTSNTGEQMNLLCEVKDKEIEKMIGLKQFNHLICPTCFEDNFFNGQSIRSIKREFKPWFEIFHSKQLCMICSSIHDLTGCRIISSGSKLMCTDECKII